MNIEEYRQKMAAIEENARLQKKELLITYCKANSPISIGDIVEDNYGSIRVDAIRCSFDGGDGNPACTYEGAVMTKKMQESKRGTRRKIWMSVQSDE